MRNTTQEERPILQVRIIRSHEPPPYPPLELRAGDAVTVKGTSALWPAFVWCVSPNGGAWVLTEYLRMRDGSDAVVSRDYTSRELRVEAGQHARILEAAGGWSFVEIGAERGWIPDTCLEHAYLRS